MIDSIFGALKKLAVERDWETLMSLAALCAIACTFLSGVSFAQGDESAQRIAGPLNYAAYTKERDAYTRYKANIESSINHASDRHEAAKRQYARCDSNLWRNAYAVFLAPIETQTENLTIYKSKAYSDIGKLHAEWIRTAREHNINSISADADISDFVIWYQGLVTQLKNDPLQRLELYVLEIEKVSKALEDMSSNCQRGSLDTALTPEISEPAIRAIIDGFVSLLN